ncbi:MAG: GNAT family N-acetyltransferase [Ruminococcaceae bacterium]|jgi:ribosomal protein S18 acetylase RimI-like enzyme|nr:GNAT family N-acetyltransferase [Oscillospiraceae bacterium]
MNDIELDLIPALPEDLEEIQALTRLAAAETAVTDWDDFYPNREILSNDIAHHGLYKLVREGEIFSVLMIRPWAEYLAEEEDVDQDFWDDGVKNPCAMARFCIAPKLQGKGLARRIVTAALAKARALGYDGVRFEAAKDNVLTLHLYDSMGFHRAGEMFGFDSWFVAYEMRI